MDGFHQKLINFLHQKRKKYCILIFDLLYYISDRRQHEGGKFCMSTIWVVLIALLALIAGVALGFFIARKYMMNYLKKNPPINEQMLRTLMMQMGQKPSQKKINQMMRAMNNQNTK